MARTEIVCRHCHQVNVRHSGWQGFLLDPRWPENCTICMSPLDGSPRGVVDAAIGRIKWAAVYFLHAFVGAGILMVGSLILWPGMMNRPWFVRVAPMAAGLVAGLLLAERSRRAGTLGHRRR